MRRKKVKECAVTLNESFLIKTANSNVMPALRGFRWYPYYVAPD